MPAWPKPSQRRKSTAQRSKEAVDDNRPGVYNRDGRQCIVTGSEWAISDPCIGALTIQHATGKGMGGSALFDSPEMLRTMCTGHNVLQTSDAAFARHCLRMGWSLERNRVDVDPTRVPVRYPDGLDYFLDSAFQRHEISHRTAEEIRNELYGVDIDQVAAFARAQGVELLPWQLEFAHAVLSGKRAFYAGGRQTGRTATKRLVDEYIRLVESKTITKGNPDA